MEEVAMKENINRLEFPFIATSFLIFLNGIMV